MGAGVSTGVCWACFLFFLVSLQNGVFKPFCGARGHWPVHMNQVYSHFSGTACLCLAGESDLLVTGDHSGTRGVMPSFLLARVNGK